MPLSLVRSLLVLGSLAPLSFVLPLQDPPSDPGTPIAPAAPEKGKPRSYWRGLYGCWDATGAGKDRPRAIVWLAHDPKRGNALYGMVEFLDAAGKGVSHEYILDAQPTFEGRRLRGRVGSSSSMWDLTLAADGNSISGTWSGEPTLWTRRVPVISSVEVMTSEAALSYWNLRSRWNEGKQNIVVLRLRGEGLPTIWTQVLDVECDDPAIARDQWRKSDDGSIELRLSLASQVRPGRKTLTINGATASFELVISNFQPPDAMPLVVWMRRATATSWVVCDEPLRYGEEWRVRVTFPGEAPTRDIIEIDLTGVPSTGARGVGATGAGGAGIVLAYRDPKTPALFETRTITIMPTAEKEGGR